MWELALFADTEFPVEEVVEGALLALPRCLIEDALEVRVAVEAVGDVPALHTELQSTLLALALGSQKVVKELIATHAFGVLASQAETQVALLMCLVEEDADLVVFCR